MGAATSVVDPTGATPTTAADTATSTKNDPTVPSSPKDGKLQDIELGNLDESHGPAADQGFPTTTTATATTVPTSQKQQTVEHRGSKDSLTFYRNFGKDTCCVGTPSCSTHPCCGRSWWRVYVVGLPLINARQLCSSYFVSDRVLLAGRIVLTLYGTAVLIGTMCINMSEGYWFFYFTNLSYLGLIIYMWVGSLISLAASPHTLTLTLHLYHTTTIINTTTTTTTTA